MLFGVVGNFRAGKSYVINHFLRTEADTSCLKSEKSFSRDNRLWTKDSQGNEYLEIADSLGTACNKSIHKDNIYQRYDEIKAAIGFYYVGNMSDNDFLESFQVWRDAIREINKDAAIVIIVNNAPAKSTDEYRIICRNIIEKRKGCVYIVSTKSQDSKEKSTIHRFIHNKNNTTSKVVSTNISKDCESTIFTTEYKKNLLNNRLNKQMEKEISRLKGWCLLYCIRLVLQFPSAKKAKLMEIALNQFLNKGSNNKTAELAKLKEVAKTGRGFFPKRGEETRSFTNLKSTLDSMETLISSKAAG